MSIAKRIVSFPPSYGPETQHLHLIGLCILRMLVENSGDNGHAVDLYSKALRSVIDEKRTIDNLDKLQKVKYVGPKISRVRNDFSSKPFSLPQRL